MLQLHFADAKVPRKKRDPNPGVRHQGGRIYDSENGTTCHQCRQKTLEIKAKCTACTLYFCPRCLENRYNENVNQVNTLPDWNCPRCRQLCNCSNCRKKAGLGATGILAKVARTAGFSCVSDLLNKNPNAKAVYRIDVAELDPSVDNKATRRQVRGANKSVRKKLSNPANVCWQHEVGQTYAEPDAKPVALETSFDPLPFQIPGQRDSNQGGLVLQDECLGKLTCILECLLTFPTTLMPWVDEEPTTSVTRVVQELLDIPDGDTAMSTSSDGNHAPHLCQLHARLLDIVIEAWSDDKESDNVAYPALVAYYAETLLSLMQVTTLRKEWGPPAVAKESYTQAAESFTTTLPKSYTDIPPPTRVAMLYSLLHDVLDTGKMRQEIDLALELEVEEERKDSARRAEARRLAREEYKRKRDQMIASLIADSNITALSLEEQRLFVDKARQQVTQDLADRLKGDASHSSEEVHSKQHSKVRVVPCAVDGQTGRLSYKLTCSQILTAYAEDVVICSRGDDPFTGPDAVYAFKVNKIFILDD